MEGSTLTSILAVLSTLAAAWAAWESRRSATASQAALEAQLLKNFMDDYFLDDMSEALRTLVDWKKAGDEAFAATWLDKLSKGDQTAKAVDVARRRVKGFFHKAARMRKGGLVSKGSLALLASVNGLNVYLDVVIPLEDALNAGRDREADDLLKRELGRYEHGTPRV
jgi:hypothetical protein